MFNRKWKKSSSYLDGGLKGHLFGENEQTKNNDDTDQDAEPINQEKKRVEKREKKS